MKKFNLPILTKDEAGNLKGGFAIQSVSDDSTFGASNGNCLGGGWFDTNTNCTGTCSKCSVNKTDIGDIRNNGPHPTTGSPTVSK